MNISKEQNKEENVSLLAASRRLYSDAKRILTKRLVYSFVLGCGATAAYYQLGEADNIKLWIGIAGLIAAVIELAYSSQEDNLRDMAARVQEEFDTNLYRMEWNEDVAGKKVDREKINKAARLYGDKRKDLLDWYPDPQPLPEPFNILLCQRINAVWNRRLTESSSKLFTAVPLLVCLAVFLLGLYTELTLKEFVALSLVWMSFLRASGSMAKKMNQAFTASNSFAEKVISTWDGFLSHSIPIEIEETRKLQSELFRLRKNNISPPDFIHFKSRNENEQDVRATALQLKQAALNSLKIETAESQLNDLGAPPKEEK